MASSSALYGIIGVLGIVVVGGGAYIAKQQGAFDEATRTAAVTAPAPAATPTPAPVPPPAAAPAPAPTLPPIPKPPVAAAPQPAPPPAPPAGPSAAQLEQMRALVTDARRAITRADFASADRALIQAERIDGRAADVIAARRDLREAQERAARGDRRIDTLVTEARAAIARHDWTAADRLLGQAEQIDGRDRAVQQARAELTDARRQPGRDNRRIDSLITEARAAIARHDYAGAGRLLDQAERVDPRDRTLQQARAELREAQQRDPRDNRRVDALVAEARAAIARHDYAAADRLLDQAENIDSRDRDVQQARAELNAAAPRPGPPPRR